jgi:hypothetical protein
MYYGENGTVKFLKTLADNVFRHNYSSMITIKRGVTTQPESIKRGVTKQTQSENLKWLL